MTKAKPKQQTQLAPRVTRTSGVSSHNSKKSKPPTKQSTDTKQQRGKQVQQTMVDYIDQEPDPTLALFTGDCKYSVDPNLPSFECASQEQVSTINEELVKQLHNTVVQQSNTSEVTAESHAFDMWLEFMKTNNLSVNKWEFVKKDDLIVTDYGLVNATFRYPPEQKVTSRHKINLLDTFEQHVSDYECKASRLLCMKTDCQHLLFKLFAPEIPSQHKDGLECVFTDLLALLKTPITNCAHLREARDGKLKSEINFFRIVPTPTPTPCLNRGIPNYEQAVQSDEPGKHFECKAKNVRKPTTAFCEALCDRINTAVCQKKSLNTAECINLLLGKETLRTMIETGFISDMSLFNFVALSNQNAQDMHERFQLDLLHLNDVPIHFSRNLTQHHLIVFRCFTSQKTQSTLEAISSVINCAESYISHQRLLVHLWGATSLLKQIVMIREETSSQWVYVDSLYIPHQSAQIFKNNPKRFVDQHLQRLDSFPMSNLGQITMFQVGAFYQKYCEPADYWKYYLWFKIANHNILRHYDLRNRQNNNCHDMHTMQSFSKGMPGLSEITRIMHETEDCQNYLKSVCNDQDPLGPIDFDADSLEYLDHTKEYVLTRIREYLQHEHEPSLVLEAHNYLQHFERNYGYQPGSSRIQIRWLFGAPDLESKALWDDCPPIFVQTLKPILVNSNIRDVALLVTNFRKWIDKNIHDQDKSAYITKELCQFIYPKVYSLDKFLLFVGYLTKDVTFHKDFLNAAELALRSTLRELLGDLENLPRIIAKKSQKHPVAQN